MKPLDNKATAARFLLGGIGTGNISLDQNARLCDFELWNRPNKGFRSPYTFFALRTAADGGDVRIKALESQLTGPFTYSHGATAWDVGGLPRFKNSEMTANYPFVNIKLIDGKMPVKAELTAFTPFIPLNVDDSSIPAAVLRYTIKNISEKPLTVSVAGSMANLCNLSGRDIWNKPEYDGESVNRFVQKPACRGINFLPAGKNKSDADYLDMSLLTTEKEGISYLDEWNEGAWWDGLQDFWNDFSDDGELTPGRELPGKGNSLHKSPISVASLCVKKEILPGKQAEFEFIISWYHPNRVKSWNQDSACGCGSCGCEPESNASLIRNYYAKFGPSLKAAEYLIHNLPELERLSRSFAGALTGGSMPEYALDAVSANITVIRSSTCFMVEDGRFFGWEGCFDSAGCCDGNCTHVWNYTQTLAYLFPELERSMRRTEFLDETENDGRMYFRARHFLEDPEHELPPATDGQLGTVVRLYRDWKISGDDSFLKEVWPKAKLALEYAFTFWDADADGVMECEQHNTYDIEFYGMTSMLNSIFYAALRAAEEISIYLNDNDSAEKYAKLRTAGAKKLDSLTFNGEYYEQLLNDVNEYKYQYGKGCLSDQLLGQYQAHASGLGYIMDENHVKSALLSVYKYNFIEDFSDHINLQRTYALNRNSGLVMCSWPNGGRPDIPFVYSDEVWTGIEYQVAAHLIYEGYVDEGLKIVEACRSRHDGVERSPWNEVECGHHYARSLASYAVLLALTGFRCDAVNKTLSFKPAISQDKFEGFFCCADGWGIYRQVGTGDAVTGEIQTLYGDLSGYKVEWR